MRKFLHIGINFWNRPTEVTALIPVFDKAIDWIRYAPNCWVVLTSSEPDVWYRRLKPVLHDQDSFLICELSISKGFPLGAGHLPGAWWDWFRKYSEHGAELQDLLPQPDDVRSQPASLPPPKPKT
jgi:hypothetical protein